MELIRQDDEYDEKKLLLWVICNVLSLFFFFFGETNTHTQKGERKRERGSNIKIHYFWV